MNGVNIRIPAALILLLAFVAPLDVAFAQRSGPDSSLLRLHSKAEELYQRGHFERAYFIYVKELAAIGDKYAQYMAGYMCLNGQGMPPDPVQASAWYRLAAERGIPEFIEVRDQLLESMSEAERVRSDARFIELRRKYSDLAVALKRVREARHKLNSGVTGTLLPGRAGGPVTILDPDSGAAMSREVYFSRIENRMQVRLDYITNSMNVERVAADMPNREFEAFADQVQAFLTVIDDR